MNDRKYRQRGYQDSGRRDEGGRKDAPRRPAAQSFGPRPHTPLASRTISRCSACGTVLSRELAAVGDCGKCGAALHACVQCAHFDPGSRFQCNLPVPEAIPDKSGRNDCTLFELRTVVERDASSGAASGTDARSALDSLFKKK